MTKAVSSLSAVTTETRAVPGADHERVASIHPAIVSVLDKLGLDAHRAPNDEAWRRFLGELTDAFASAATDRRHVRPPAEVIVAQLAQAAGLTDGTDLLDSSGVPNHQALVIALGKALRVTADSAEVAVLVVGLDGLSRVSDRLGDQGRQEVLANAAERIRSVVRAVDLVTRVEADEFAVLLGGLATAEPVRAISHRIERAFTEPLTAVGHYVYFTAHVGAALARAGSSPTDALRRGRMALEWQRSTRNHPTARGGHLRQVAASA